MIYKYPCSHPAQTTDLIGAGWNKGANVGAISYRHRRAYLLQAITSKPQSRRSSFGGGVSARVEGNCVVPSKVEDCTQNV